MIGVYDSGLGGLTVLAALRAAAIDDDVVYFADQAHVPYGERTDADLHGLLTTNLGWLEGQGVDEQIEERRPLLQVGPVAREEERLQVQAGRHGARDGGRGL